MHANLDQQSYESLVQVLVQHPCVEAAAVVGLPHVRLGEQVAALVQLKKTAAARVAGENEHGYHV